MDDIFYSSTRKYKIKPNSLVYLTVTIGNLNVGGTIVELDGTEICRGEITNKEIGEPGENLLHKFMQCTTTVQDKNPSTNITTVNCTLSGGEKTESFTFSVEVKENGGKAIYSLTFIFI
jgi:hypothetical protein